MQIDEAKKKMVENVNKVSKHVQSEIARMIWYARFSSDVSLEYDV